MESNSKASLATIRMKERINKNLEVIKANNRKIQKGGISKFEYASLTGDNQSRRAHIEETKKCYEKYLYRFRDEPEVVEALVKGWLST